MSSNKEIIWLLGVPQGSPVYEEIASDEYINTFERLRDTLLKNKHNSITFELNQTQNATMNIKKPNTIIVNCKLPHIDLTDCNCGEDIYTRHQSNYSYVSKNYFILIVSMASIFIVGAVRLATYIDTCVIC